MAIKFCPECGYKFDKESKFCPECGYALQQQAPATTPQPNTSEDLFGFGLSGIEAGFDKQLQAANTLNANLKRAFALCLRGKYSEALELYNKVLDEDYLNSEAAIGIVRAGSENFTLYDYPTADLDMNAALQMCGGLDNVQDKDFKKYFAARQNAIEQAKRKEEEAKRKAAEEKRKAEEEAKRRAEESKRKAEEEARRKAQEAKRKAEEAARRKAEEQARKAQAAVLAQQADDDWDNKNYANVYGTAQKALALDKNNVIALYLVGACYLDGHGVAQDYKEAVKWFQMGAERGYARAQNFLAYCYFGGKGVASDSALAFQWWTKAAEQGFAAAQFWLGECYYYGWGTTRNYAQAVKWFTKAAEQGHSEAQRFLGICYQNGQGVTTDRSKAIYWYQKSAAQGNGFAKKALSEL